MQTLLEFAQGRAAFMPHGMCYLWQPDLLWLHVISDALVALAYYAIPPVLIYLVIRARAEMKNDSVMGMQGLPFDWVLLAFGIFIVACGTTHVFAVITVWKPVYWLSGSAKVVTAVASVATAVALPPFAPRVLDLMRAARENEQHRRALEQAHDELRELNRRLREMDRVKSAFFANVSHELRTPLTLILGPVERILEDPDLNAVHLQRARVVHGSALQLVSMVDDLLEITQLEDGSAAIHPVDLDLVRLVQSTADTFTPTAGVHGIDFQVEASGVLSAHLDRSKTQRAITNLLADAFRFTPRGGTVRLSLDRSDGVARIRVEDSATEPTEEISAGIFDRFSTTDRKPTRRFGGTGLALSVARDFVELQGGHVTAEPSALGGVAFVIELPCVSGSPIALVTDETAESVDIPATPDTSAPKLVHQAPATPPPSSWPEDDVRPRLLVVDDDEGMRTYLADVLSDEFSCACVADAPTAIALATEAPPSVIVTALSLPGMDGERFVRRLRHTPGLSDVPVLVLTGRADPALPARVLSGGAQDYLVKPVRVDELVARVRNLVAAASARVVLRAALGGGHGDLAALSTELAARTKDLEQAILDKETLLQELHHRVKGNLQTVASLMNLQLRSLEDPAARKALTDSRSRVRAIALLHERLYRDGQPTHVELGGYLRGLASELAEAFAGVLDSVEIDVHVDTIALDVERAVACGLIAHELIVNALEHGTAEGRPSVVTLSLGQWDGSAVLSVQDDGPGLPDGPRNEGLGLQLVEALTRQLRGELRFDNREGFLCEIRFPLRWARRKVSLS